MRHKTRRVKTGNTLSEPQRAALHDAAIGALAPCKLGWRRVNAPFADTKKHTAHTVQSLALRKLLEYDAPSRFYVITRAGRDRLADFAASALSARIIEEREARNEAA